MTKKQHCNNTSTNYELFTTLRSK